MSATRAGKGANRASEMAPDALRALSRGERQSRTLAECLAVDQALLLRTVFPELSAQAGQCIDAVQAPGILKRMAGVGQLLFDELGSEGWTRCRQHGADTVRGWACFMVAAQPGMALSARLAAIRPLADDAHFGVREWAWMALRPHLVRELDSAIAQLAAWTASPSANLRRFASEALRPRGVWAAHIAPLKQQPALGLPLLTPLRADPAAYVQDSVANWLNDAAKDQPAWVRALCREWLQGTPPEATRRICARAQRSISH